MWQQRLQIRTRDSTGAVQHDGSSTPCRCWGTSELQQKTTAGNFITFKGGWGRCQPFSHCDDMIMMPCDAVGFPNGFPTFMQSFTCAYAHMHVCAVHNMDGVSCMAASDRSMQCSKNTRMMCSEQPSTRCQNGGPIVDSVHVIIVI